MGMSKAPSRNNTANTNNRSNEGKKLLKVHNSHISTTQNMMMIDTRVSQRKELDQVHISHITTTQKMILMEELLKVKNWTKSKTHTSLQHRTWYRWKSSSKWSQQPGRAVRCIPFSRNETNRANKERVQVFRSHALIAMAGVTAKGMKTSARMYPALSLRDDGVSVK